MKILITGGCGFVGTNLIPLLKDYEVVIIDNLTQGEFLEVHKVATFYKADIRNAYEMKEIFNREQPDIVFHFAGMVSIYECHKNPALAAENNIMGSINVFNAALASGCNRVIFSESSAVYEGCELLEAGFNETQSDPTTFYSTTKAAVALIADSYSRTRGLDYTALRYFNIAGPIQDYSRTVPPLFAGVALRLLGGNNPIVFGDGTRERDFIHVDDVNKFHLQCIVDERTINETFNLGTGDSTSLFEISDIIHKYLEIDKELQFDIMDEINGEAHTIYANIDKAKSIGWSCDKTINDAIYDTVDYLKNEIKLGNVDPNIFMVNINTDEVKI